MCVCVDRAGLGVDSGSGRGYRPYKQCVFKQSRFKGGKQTCLCRSRPRWLQRTVRGSG